MNEKLKMSEAELQSAIIDLARLRKWRVAHFRAAQTAKGWRTPVAADGAGFPDLVLVRTGRLIFAELKSTTGGTSREQWAWLKDLSVCGERVPRVIEVHLWRPQDWREGTIERALAPESHDSRLEASQRRSEALRIAPDQDRLYSRHNEAQEGIDA